MTSLVQSTETSQVQSSEKLNVSSTVTSQHRKRIELEYKAKVVASVWGTEFAQFLAGLAILPRTI